MKRSDMVTAINDLITNGGAGPEVMDLIEQAGMLPPPITTNMFPMPTVTPDQWEPEAEEEVVDEA